MHRLLLKHIKQPTEKLNLGFQHSETTVIHQHLSDLPSNKTVASPDISQKSVLLQQQDPDTNEKSLIALCACFVVPASELLYISRPSLNAWP